MERVTVIGGGLAGLALGIALRAREVPVRIVEAGRFPRHKVCGEFLHGVRAATVRALGLEEELARGLAHRTVAFCRNGEARLRATLPFPARGLSRHGLDARLAERFAAAGGELRTGETLPAEGLARPDPGMVLACGRPPLRSPWIGLKMHVQGVELGADLELHIGRAAYAGCSRVEEGRANVCGLFRLEHRPRGRGPEMVLDGLRQAGLGALAAKLAEAEPDPASVKATAGIRFGWATLPEGAVAVGDRLAQIPPFTGNGMSMALEGAALAAAALAAWAAGKAAWPATVRTIRRRQRQAFRQRLAIARTVHPFLHHPAGQPVLALLAAARLVPFGPLLAATR